MNKFLKLYGYILIITFLTLGCSDKKDTTDETDMVSQNALKQKIEIQSEYAQQQSKPSEQQATQKEVQNQQEKESINSIFKDSVDLLPNGKYMIMLFDSKNCSYCIKLKKEILANEELKNRIKNNFSAYQLSLDENRVYNFLYHKKIVKADTNLLKNIYSITSTPTLLFDDKDAKNILIITGYIPPKQLSVTLDFIEQELWKGKDRKNGEVYKALEEYYAKRGLIEKGEIETH